MAKTVVGLYNDLTTAEQVVRELTNSGFSRDDISLVANDAEGRYGKEVGTGDRASTGKGAAKGAGTGAVLGGIAGLVVGLGALAIPGIGPIIAAGPLATTLAGAGVGAAAGGLVGALTKAGVPEEDAKFYSEGVRRGGTLVMVKAPEDMAQRASDIMNRFDPVDVDQRSASWRKDNWRGFDESARPYTTRDVDDERARYSTGDFNTEGEKTLPIVEEEMNIGKREVQRGGVRVHTYVEEKPVEQNVNVRDETVNVERRPVDRPASEADLNAFREGTFEVTETDEEVVAEKRPHVTEEVVINKDVEQRNQNVRDTVRRTNVETEDIGTKGRSNMSESERNRNRDFESGSTSSGSFSGKGTDFDTFEPGFRQHFNTNYSNRGYNYDYYQPAYRYGYDLRQNQRFSGKQWNDIQGDVRKDWERSHPNNKWDDFKDAIRQGWESVTNR